MTILKSMRCTECGAQFPDQIIMSGERVTCYHCGGSCETDFSDYKLGTGKEYRPTLARKKWERPKKIDKNKKPID